MTPLLAGRDGVAVGFFMADVHRPVPEVRCRRITGLGVAFFDGRAAAGVIDNRSVRAELTESGYTTVIPGRFTPTGHPIELAVGAHAEALAYHGPAAVGLVPAANEAIP